MPAERVTPIDKGKFSFVVGVAHPDDEAGMFGATLSLLAQEGHRTTLVVATNGERGSKNGESRRTTAKTRIRELAESANILGISRRILLGLPDDEIAAPRQVRRARKGMLRVIREEDPDGVFRMAHDTSQAHGNFGDTVEWAAEHASDTTIRTRSTHFPWREIPATTRQVVLLQAMPQGLKDRQSQQEGYDPEDIAQPDTVVTYDGETLDTKIAAYNAHVSQKSNRLAGQSDFAEQLRVEAGVVGDLVDEPHGEGFNQISYGGEKFSAAPLLEKALPGRVFRRQLRRRVKTS